MPWTMKRQKTMTKMFLFWQKSFQMMMCQFFIKISYFIPVLMNHDLVLWIFILCGIRCFDNLQFTMFHQMMSGQTGIAWLYFVLLRWAPGCCDRLTIFVQGYSQRCKLPWADSEESCKPLHLSTVTGSKPWRFGVGWSEQTAWALPSIILQLWPCTLETNHLLRTLFMRFKLSLPSFSIVSSLWENPKAVFNPFAT